MFYWANKGDFLSKLKKVQYLFISMMVGVVLFCAAPSFAYAEDTSEKHSVTTSLSETFHDMIAEINNCAEEYVYQSKLEKIKDTVEQYLGVPYVWGGTTPRGFDCSGLVQYVYNECGISLPRTTYSQINCGQAVSLDNLVCGDLVFWGNYHVGIYVGDGKYIHAPHSGTVVQVQSMSNYMPTSARRIVSRQ